MKMKWFIVVSVFTVMFCVRESDGFKILKKLKEILHPTVPPMLTTTVLPTIPEYENQHGQKEDDSSSWERESSTSSSKNKHSGEDSSTSESSEHQGGSVSSHKKKYNPVEPEKAKPYPGYSYTTETSNSNSGYGGDQGNDQFSSYGSTNDRESSRTTTTTDTYDQSNNNEHHPGQSSFLGDNNGEVKSTTPNSYSFGSQNQPDQLSDGINNQENQSTTEHNYDGSYNSNQPGQSASYGGSLDEIPSSTTKKVDVSWGNSENVGQSTSTYGSQDQNHDDKSQSTTTRTDYSYNDINNIPDQSSSFGSTSNNVGPSESTGKHGSSQDKNYDDQSSMFGNVNTENTLSSTPRSYDSSNGFDKPDQSSSFDGQNTQSATSNNRTTDRPEQSPSYNDFNTGISTTTQTYDDTNLNEVDPGVSSGSNYNAGSFLATPTTPADLPATSLQGGNQHQQTSGSQPHYSSTKGSHQTKHQDNDDGNIIFPDDPSLNPTPETVRTYDEHDPYFKRVRGQYSTASAPVTDQDDTYVKPVEGQYHAKPAPVPVNDEEGRHIADAPSKTCGPGKTLDKQYNTCKVLARK